MATTTAVRKAVIPAAGLGTRFLPATKAQPKEMLPVVDKPAIQYVVEEAVAAGITDILIVTGRSKKAVEDHFDRAPELEYALEASGKQAELDVVRSLVELADIHFIRQPQARGLGHAIGMGRAHVGSEPFAVLLPDDLFLNTVLADMLALHAETGSTVLALKSFPEPQISAYGAVDHVTEDGRVKIQGVVEKPPPGEAPSDLAILGRYVFTPEIFEAIEQTPPGRGGEIQITDAIGLLMKEQSVYGHVFDTGRYDTGQKLDWLRATVELAVARDDLGPGMREIIAEVAKREGLV